MLTVSAWNAKEGRSSADVAETVDAELAHVKPIAYVVAEAAGYRLAIDAVARRHGYVVRQLAAPIRRGGLYLEDASTAVLIRGDVGVASARPWRMLVPFRGAVHGHRHQPRVYWRSLLVVPGVGKVRASFGHWPTQQPRSNRAACLETETRVRVWFRLSRLPAFHVGDLNRSAAWLRERFPGLTVIAGAGPDHLLAKGLTGRATVHSKAGSDHHRIRFHLDERKPRR